MILVLTTCPSRSAPRIIRTLLSNRLAACVSRIDGLASEYRWEGKVEKAAETLLLIKAPSRRWKALQERLRAIHPYKVPEIVAFRSWAAERAYTRWLRKETLGD
ncbi:MAG: divalent-cation tolerance protein CutA [Planctomycetota bacterium]